MNTDMMEIKVSTLPKTWIFDLDGTLVVHNGYVYGGDELLEGVKEWFLQIPTEDKILILTARTDDHREITTKFLTENELRFDEIIFNLPAGERILINDCKPKGLLTAVAINLERNKERDVKVVIDDML